MINTVQIKNQLFEGGFSAGDPAAGEVVLMLGSCRGVPHLNFLNWYNETHGRPYSIHYIDPFDLNWDRTGHRTDLAEATARMEGDERITGLLERTTIFIHEHFSNFGMFNTDKHREGNVYGHGMAPRLDISLPNFHDRFILFQNIVDFDPRARELVGDGVAPEAMAYVRGTGLEAMRGFREMCKLTSFPEFADYFEANCRSKRMFLNHNHVSNHFTIPLFRMMDRRFLHLQAGDAFYDELHKGPDMYANANVCPLTRHDVEAHGWQWDEPLAELKL